MDLYSHIDLLFSGLLISLFYFKFLNQITSLTDYNGGCAVAKKYTPAVWIFWI